MWGEPQGAKVVRGRQGFGLGEVRIPGTQRERRHGKRPACEQGSERLKTRVRDLK